MARDDGEDSATSPGSGKADEAPSESRQARGDASVLEQIVENLPDMVFLKDAKELRFVRFNRAGEALLGYGRDELLGKNDYDFFPREEAEFFVRKDREVLAAGGLVDIPEERIHTKKLGERILHTKKVPIHDSTGEPIYLLGISEDVTELVHMRRQLSDTRAELDASRLRERQKLELLGIVAGGIAHDFNNLLVGILGNANLASDLAEGNAELRGHIASIERAANQAAQLTGQMLAYSGRGRIVVEVLDVAELVRGSLSLLAASIDKRAVIELALEAGAVVEADSSQLQQLVLNLVTNAADALEGRPGKIVISVRREQLAPEAEAQVGDVEPITEGEYVTIEVRDTGTGMSESIVGRVFEPFFSTKAAGHGLGLAATIGIVRAHKGALRVRSVVGEGTSFRICLPSHAGPVLEREERAPATIPDGDSVLVVDDEALIVELVTNALSRSGVRCEAFCNPLEALAAVKAAPRRFGAVLLDMSMPQMDGRTCLREIRKICPEMPVVLSSGYDESQHPVLAGERTWFLKKPYRIASLIESLSTALRVGQEP